MRLLKIDLRTNQRWIDNIESKNFDNKIIFNEIDEYLMKNNEELEVIDAVKMMNDNFKQAGDFTVFLSHSHDDIEAVKKLTTLLEKNGQKVFIDSIYWNYFEKLLKRIDDKYALNQDRNSYSYEKRNITTAVVHNLLSISLQKMIEKCEYFIFLDSNSIDKVNINTKKSTTSPWIYLELSTIALLKQRVEKGIRSRDVFNKALWFNYDIKDILTKFEEINEENDLLCRFKRSQYE
ncbi:hypothetical protein [Staphylococcus debuckii]|uniref:Toll/interleukin-1 receptor domain-containing protein n=1 Tax=Staphylococcus debuckii TaxID=2044912 RepID=A0ABU9EXC3_9STAP